MSAEGPLGGADADSAELASFGGADAGVMVADGFLDAAYAPPGPPAGASSRGWTLWVNLGVYGLLFVLGLCLMPVRNLCTRQPQRACKGAHLAVQLFATLRLAWAVYLLYKLKMADDESMKKEVLLPPGAIEYVLNSACSLFFFWLAGFVIAQASDVVVDGWKSAMRVWACFRVFSAVLLLAISSLLIVFFVVGPFAVAKVHDTEADYLVRVQRFFESETSKVWQMVQQGVCAAVSFFLAVAIALIARKIGARRAIRRRAIRRAILRRAILAQFFSDAALAALQARRRCGCARRWRGARSRRCWRRRPCATC